MDAIAQASDNENIYVLLVLYANVYGSSYTKLCVCMHICVCVCARVCMLKS